MASPTLSRVVVAPSPQATLDRLREALLNLTDTVADVERLDASPSFNLTPGETAAVGFLRGEMVTAIKERLTDLQEASPSLARMARGDSPSHREVDRAFLRAITGKIEALEAATHILIGVAAFGATQVRETGAN